MSIRGLNLDQRVTLQSRAVATDAMGQETITWTDVITVYADVSPMPGREFAGADQMQTEQPIRVRMHYRSDVATTWRAVWKGRHHDITSVASPRRVAGRGGWVDVRNNEMTERVCMQGVKDGR